MVFDIDCIDRCGEAGEVNREPWRGVVTVGGWEEHTIALLIDPNELISATHQAPRLYVP